MATQQEQDRTQQEHNKRKGLSSTQAAERMRSEGPNELRRSGKRTIFSIIFEVLREPMLLLLLVGGLVYLLLGDKIEALILLIFACLSIAITVVQESRTERVLEALSDLTSPRALVIRDGERIRIAGREVVREDILVLEQGDRVAADAILLESIDLQTDESLLTGESLPVGKVVNCDSEDTQVDAKAGAKVDGKADTNEHRPGGDKQPYVYSGSLIVRGSGIARVIATGPKTEIGKIGQSLASLDTESPRLKKETGRIVAWSALAGLTVAVLVVVLYGLSRGQWLEAVLAGIAVGMSMLPEEFPVVLTVFMAMGAWRIGKAGVLTRRAAAIETLGSATVLCTDKTGTLTENRMALAQVWLPSGETQSIDASQPAQAPYHHLMQTAVLASAVDPLDPMEIALLQAYHAVADSKANEISLQHTYGLRPELLAMSNIWDDCGELRICAKGAPEAIAELCQLSLEAKQEMLDAVEAMGLQGIRVLAVASGTASDRQWAESQQDYSYRLVGLVGLADPIRASVPAAIAECRQAGIRVVMITGDYAVTARSIATQAGIPEGDVLTGSDLEALSDEELAQRLNTVTVFARIMPEQKLRIVQAFKRSGEIAAMTGDGVNDAPSLKAAHIGVAMGKRGTDVAREASDMVLMDDDFGSIVKSVSLGRRIYDNMRKAMAFILAVHVPIAGLALLPLFFGAPMLLAPVHIALLEMVIDPVCTLVFEAEREEDDIMQRPPRDPAESMFSMLVVLWSLFQGGLAFVMLASVFLWKTGEGMPEVELRALLFFALIAQVLALILVNRSFSASLVVAFTRKNNALAYVVFIVLAVTALILFLPTAQGLLKFGLITWSDMGLALALGVALLVVLEVCKPLVSRFSSRRREAVSP